MQNYEQNNTSSPKSGMKKIIIGILSLIVVVAVIVGVVWFQQDRAEFNITGTVDQISMEDQNIVVQQVTIKEDRFGRYDRDEQLFTVSWNEDTEFIIEGVEGENLNAQNEILSPESTLKIKAKEQITKDSILAESIRLIERSPFRE